MSLKLSAMIMNSNMTLYVWRDIFATMDTISSVLLSLDFCLLFISSLLDQLLTAQLRRFLPKRARTPVQPDLLQPPQGNPASSEKQSCLLSSVFSLLPYCCNGVDSLSTFSIIDSRLLFLIYCTAYYLIACMTLVIHIYQV